MKSDDEILILSVFKETEVWSPQIDSGVSTLANLVCNQTHSWQ